MCAMAPPHALVADMRGGEQANVGRLSIRLICRHTFVRLLGHSAGCNREIFGARLYVFALGVLYRMRGMLTLFYRGQTRQITALWRF